MPPWRTITAALSQGQWLTRDRAVGYGAILLGYELIAGVYLIAQTHGLIGSASGPSSTDFVSFYAAGTLANAGHAALTYQKAAHFAVEQALSGNGIPYNFFYYPPIFLILCAGLARLPYLAAFVLFEALSLLVYLGVAKKVLGERRWTVLLPLAAFPAVFWSIGMGQNSLLTAALFGSAMLAIDDRPILAGILIGALAYKPHFGLVIPIALAAGRNWRAFLAAAIAVVAQFAISVAVFGWQTWHAFFAAASGSHAIYESLQIDRAGLATPFGAVLMLGGSATLAYAVQVATALLAAGWVAYIWRRGCSLPIRAAALIAAVPLAVPVLLHYDLMLDAIATAFLLRAAREIGFMPWQKLALAMLYFTPIFMGSTNMSPRFLLAPAVSLALFTLAICAACREMRLARSAALNGLRTAASWY